MRILPSAAIVCGGALTLALSAQQAAPREQSTFRADTRLIQVSVVVHDNRRRPIEGLTATDFRVFEDGRQVPVSVFVARGAPGLGVPTQRADNVPLPGTFTNRIESPTEGGVVAILFDQLNTSREHQILARANLFRYLEKVRPGDRVALYVLTAEGIRVAHDFVQDVASLRDALHSVKTGAATVLPLGTEKVNPALLEGLSAFGKSVRDGERFLSERRRGEASVEALEAVAARLSGISGRKNLVWISSGFPFILSSGGFKTNNYMQWPTKRATRALAAADVAVYPVDTRGLIAGNARGHAPGLATIQEPIEGLHAVANWTGGRLFYNTNDIAGAITQAVDDSRVSYVLGYYPPDQALDGQFREVKVKVNRRGVEVRHRPGYYAYPPEGTFDANKASVIEAAIAHPLESTGLSLSVKPVDAAVPGTLRLVITIEPGGVTFSREGNQWSGSADLVTAQAYAGEAFTKDTEQRLELTIPADQAERLLSKGIQLTKTIDLREPTQRLKILVRDDRSGLIGSVIIEAAAIRAPGRRESW